MLRNWHFSASLKIDKVNPLHMSGAKTDPCNYRPILVLADILKIFKKLLYNRLNDFVIETKVLIDEKCGFLSNFSTLYGCIDLITKIKTNIDHRNIGLGIFID